MRRSSPLYTSTVGYISKTSRLARTPQGHSQLWWRHTAVVCLHVFTAAGCPVSKPRFDGLQVLVSLFHFAGDLGFHLQHLGIFTKVMAQYYTARTVLGIRHLHQKGIVYRDLKPENVMLDEFGRSRISDMGLACKVTPHLTGACGTRGCECEHHAPCTPILLQNSSLARRISPRIPAVLKRTFGILISRLF